jgi:hypothetical protein
MSEKNLDQKGRWRDRTVAFRISTPELETLNESVRLSGLTKQEYITSKLLNRDVIVAKSPKTYKALKDKMNEILTELNRIESSGDLTEEFLETIKYVTYIYAQTKED